MGVVSEVTDGVGTYALKEPSAYAQGQNVQEMIVMSDAKSCEHVMHYTDGKPCVDGRRLQFSYVAPEMKGDLKTWLKGASMSLRKKCVQGIYKELWEGMLCLHAAGWIHGDIKIDNVFIESQTPDYCPTGIRLADFGLSYKRNSTFKKYRSSQYMGSVYLPDSVFEGHGDSLKISQGPHEVKASTLIDLCSL
mmetsp:Transcript_52761/g.98802  ORF Transcript_52761/g.98802 Transcript_52761/m.98802 type:complete len:192 (+) Transcript_52761:205-780(+)